MSTHSITNPTQALEFMLAGNAYFTLRSKVTSARYTYRVSAADDADLWFVSSLYGSDNESDYAYMGLLRRDKTFRTTARSRFTVQSPQVKAFTWALGHLVAGKIPEKLEIWHEGRCGRCGRMLTVPESIASGIGPECAKRSKRYESEELVPS